MQSPLTDVPAEVRPDPDVLNTPTIPTEEAEAFWTEGADARPCPPVRSR